MVLQVSVIMSFNVFADEYTPYTLGDTITIYKREYNRDSISYSFNLKETTSIRITATIPNWGVDFGEGGSLNIYKKSNIPYRYDLVWNGSVAVHTNRMTIDEEVTLEAGEYIFSAYNCNEISVKIDYADDSVSQTPVRPITPAPTPTPSIKNYDNPICYDFGDDETDVEIGDDFWMEGYIDGNGCTITAIQIELFGPDSTDEQSVILFRDTGEWADYDIEDIIYFEWGDEVSDWYDDYDTIDTSEPGTYWIYVYVTTEEGLGFEEYVYEEFYVDGSDEDPEVYVYLDDDEYEEGEEIEVEIEFYDDEELDYYEVYHDGDLVDEGILWGDEEEITLWLEAIEGSNVEVEVYVYDSDGNEGYDWDDYDCEASGGDPEVYVYLDDDEYEEGDEIEVEIEFYDDEELDYYEVYHDGDLVKEGYLWGDEDKVTLYLDAIEGDNVEVEVYVYDSDGNEGYDWDDYDCEGSRSNEIIVDIYTDGYEYEEGDEIHFSVDMESDNDLSYYELYHNNTLYKISYSIGGDRSATVSTDIDAIVGNGWIDVYVYDIYGNCGYDVFEYVCKSADSDKPAIYITAGAIRTNDAATQFSIPDSRSLDMTVDFNNIAEWQMPVLNSDVIIYLSCEAENGLSRYVLKYNDVVIDSGSLSGNSVKWAEVSFTARDPGLNTWELIVYDTLGNSCNAYGAYIVKVKNLISKNVSVSIPSFNITINGQRINNTYAKYPYIVYNNITYFPMTYNGSRFLGLKSDWDASNGLVISKAAERSGVNENSTQSSQNSGNYSAVTTTGYIKVNGEYIDNESEQYPLINFRDVTYFPLTWRFAVDEFGWDYSFTNSGGLVINSK